MNLTDRELAVLLKTTKSGVRTLRERDPSFPRPFVVLGRNLTLESEFQAWLAAQPRAGEAA